MKTDIKNNIYNNIFIKKLLIINKIEYFNNINILTNFVIIQTEQLDTQAENLDVWNM